MGYKIFKFLTIFPFSNFSTFNLPKFEISIIPKYHCFKISIKLQYPKPIILLKIKSNQISSKTIKREQRKITKTVNKKKKKNVKKDKNKGYCQTRQTVFEKNTYKIYFIDVFRQDTNLLPWDFFVFGLFVTVRISSGIGIVEA